MADQLPIEPLTRERREQLSDALVKMLLQKEQVEGEKKDVVDGYNEQLKVLKKDIAEATHMLDEPETGIASDGSKQYAQTHQERAGIIPAAGADGKTIEDITEEMERIGLMGGDGPEDEETIEVTADDLEVDDTEIPF